MKAIKKKKVESICQDCLRIIMLENYIDHAFSHCECGGAVCCCMACYEKIKKLKNGCRDRKELGLSNPAKPDLSNWNAKTGIL